MALSGIRRAIAEATGSSPPERAVPVGGGCIHEALRLGDYFVKFNTPGCAGMFETERLGLAEIQRTGAIRVPGAICTGCADGQAFLVLEFLPLGGNRRETQEDLGRRLAELHRTTRPSFGWEHANFIGSTPQPNPDTDSWISFLREQRLGYMIRLAAQFGYKFPNATKLLDGLDGFFKGGEPAPSLLHGDLWGGNASALEDGTPVVFDPAVYYGDREADLAMTALFGGFSPRFYDAYQETWPLSDGHELRRDLYNLYHVLNHAVLFGGSYAGQAQGIIDRLVTAI